MSAEEPGAAPAAGGSSPAKTRTKPRPKSSIEWRPNNVDRRVPAPHGFGSTTHRWNHPIVGVTTAGCTAINTHTSTLNFNSPAPGDYYAARHAHFSLPRLSPEYKLGRASRSFDSPGRDRAKGTGTATVSEVTNGKESAPGMYDWNNSLDRTKSFGNVLLSNDYPSGIFKSSSTRFVYPKGYPEPDNTYNTLHAGIHLDEYSRYNRAWTAPTGANKDTRANKSPGARLVREKRFQTNTLHVHPKQVGFMGKLSCAPGYKYEPDVDVAPSVSKTNERLPGHKYVFKSDTQRFSYLKDTSPAVNWKYYDYDCSVAPTVALTTGVAAKAAPKASANFKSKTKRFKAVKANHPDHTCMPPPYHGIASAPK